eukprot:SAG31_NODE_4187_length_3491_cov_2.346698_1_plen_668_part_00
MPQAAPNFDNGSFVEKLAEEKAWYDSLDSRPNYIVQVQQSDNPEQLQFTDEEKVATGKAQTESDTWTELANAKLGTPDTITSEQPVGHPDYHLKEKGKMKKSLDDMVAQMEDGSLAASVLPLKPTLQQLLKALDQIPDAENWKNGGFTTLDELARDIGKNFTFDPIFTFFESAAVFEQDMQDPAEFQAKLLTEIAKLKARLEELATLDDFYDEEDEATIKHILQNPDFPEHQYEDIQAFEDSCGAEQAELEEQLWEKRTELLNHLPAVLKIIFDSFHGENTLDQQVSSLQATQNEAKKRCGAKKKGYLTKKNQLTRSGKELQRRIAAVDEEQKQSDKLAKKRRSQYRKAHEQGARTVQDLDKQIERLLEQRRKEEEVGRERTAENDAAERQYQCETATRNDALEMLRGCGVELQPYIEVFHKSAEVVDVMKEIAVTATDAVITLTKSKVEALQKQETQTLVLHYNVNCETFSEIAKGCALTKHNHQDQTLELEKNKAERKKAIDLRKGPQVLAKIKRDRQAIEGQKQIFEEQLSTQDERMGSLKTPEFERTVGRLSELYFNDAATPGSTDEGAAAVASVSRWVVSSLPPKMPFDELFVKFQTAGGDLIPIANERYKDECGRIDSTRQPDTPMLLQGSVPAGEGDDDKVKDTDAVVLTAVAVAAGGNS